MMVSTPRAAAPADRASLKSAGKISACFILPNARSSFSRERPTARKGTPRRSSSAPTTVPMAPAAPKIATCSMCTSVALHGARAVKRYAGTHGACCDLRRRRRHRHGGWGGTGAARSSLPRGGPFAGKTGARVRQDEARRDLSRRLERGPVRGRGGARRGHHHLLRGTSISLPPTASRADARDAGGGEAG